MITLISFNIQNGDYNLTLDYGNLGEEKLYSVPKFVLDLTKDAFGYTNNDDAIVATIIMLNNKSPLSILIDDNLSQEQKRQLCDAPDPGSSNIEELEEK